VFSVEPAASFLYKQSLQTKTKKEDYFNMRKFLAVGLVALAATAAAQTQLNPVWKITATAQTGTITNSTVTGSRGVGYNPATGNLLLATGAAVRRIRSSDGVDIGTMSVTGVSGGTRAINKVVPASDGVIWGCNLDTGATLRIYRWANETAVPVLVYDEPVNGGGTAVREGDDMDVIGTGLNTRIIVVGSGVTVVSKFTWDGTVLTRTVATPTGVAFSGSGQQVQWDPSGDGSYWWMTTSAANIYKYTAGNVGAIIGAVDTARQPFAITVAPENTADRWYSQGNGAIAGGTANPVTAARKITGGTTLGSKLFEYNYTALGAINAGSAVANASGGGDVIHDNANHSVYILYVDNSLTKFTHPQLVPVELSGFSID
jgi:hypothetical protein